MYDEEIEQARKVMKKALALDSASKIVIAIVLLKQALPGIPDATGRRLVADFITDFHDHAKHEAENDPIGH